MFLYDIFKVIYSPVKAFREILGNPRYVGPVIIIIISLLLTLGTQYVGVSKHYVETIVPSNRFDWTNITTPSSVWVSNAPPENVTSAKPLDFDTIPIGNYTRAFLTNNSTIWLRTNGIGTINCSGDSGFKMFYYKLWFAAYNSSGAALPPQNASLRLYSLKGASDYFQFDLLNNVGYLNKSAAWMDANVSIGGVGWTVGGGSPSWSNITGLEFRLTFAGNGRLSLQLNDLYFGGKYELLYEAVGFVYWLSSTFVASAFDIFLRWLMVAGFLWLTIKTFNPEGSPFKMLLVVVGYTFVIMVVYAPIDILVVSQLSPLYFPHCVVFPVSDREVALGNAATSNIYAANWVSTAPYMVFIGISYVAHAWTIVLLTVALKTLQNYSWKKAALICTIAYIMALVLRAIIPL